MGKPFTILAVLIILVAAGYLLLGRSGSVEAPAETAPPAESVAPSPAGSPEVVVEMTPEGFSPATLTIPVGTPVRFVNRDSSPRWPASGIHPTHQLCPGFDSLKGIAPGQTYTFTFTQAKTCPMHDHLKPALRGSITVE